MTESTPTQVCETNTCETSAAESCEPHSRRREFRPNTDVIQREHEVVLVVDVPGADESGLDITVERNRMTVRATVTPEANDRAIVQREYAVGDYVRTFRLADDVDREAIEATIADGVLRIVLPRTRESLSRKIVVKAR